MFKGYKTYIVAGVAVIAAIGSYLTGDIVIADAAQMIVTALLCAFLRSGIANK